MNFMRRAKPDSEATIHVPAPAPATLKGASHTHASHAKAKPAASLSKPHAQLATSPPSPFSFPSPSPSPSTFPSPSAPSTPSTATPSTSSTSTVNSTAAPSTSPPSPPPSSIAPEFLFQSSSSSPCLSPKTFHATSNPLDFLSSSPPTDLLPAPSSPLPPPLSPTQTSTINSQDDSSAASHVPTTSFASSITAKHAYPSPTNKTTFLPPSQKRIPRDKEIENLQQELSSLKQQINTLRRNNLQDNRAESDFLIRPCYTLPEEQWIESMLAGQKMVEEMYESIGSRLVIPPLLETDAMNTTVDDDEREDDRLSLEEFCSRYAPLVSDEQTREGMRDHINTLRSNPTGPVRGHKIGAINAINSLLKLDKLRTCIIICGHESSGKTSLLECLIGCRLGYSDAGRATVCPVIYTFVFKEGEPGYYQNGGDQREVEQCAPKQLEDLPGFVKQHMQAIKQSSGISRKELYIKIVSGNLIYAGIIVDCPGTTVSPQGSSDAIAEQDFKERVREIIDDQVQQANPQNSVILCLERKMLDQTQGGCGHFYNEVLSKTKEFPSFKSKVKMVFNYNDHQFRGDLQNEWTESYDRVDDLKDYLRTYNVINQYFFSTPNPPAPDSIFFISMKHLQDLYDKNTTPDKLETLREELLNHNSLALKDLLEKTDSQLARKFNADYRFSFSNLKDSIFNEIEKSSDKYVRKVLDSVLKFRNKVREKLDTLSGAASDESRYDNESVVGEAWREFSRAWSAIAEENHQSPVGIGLIDLHFDADEWCTELHKKFPLGLNFDWPSYYFMESTDQTLERYLQIHNMELLFADYEDMQEFLQQHVDLYASKKLNLVNAYERMIDSMCCRIASILLKYVDPEEFHNLLGNGIHMRGAANMPSMAAFCIALKALELFYVQFLAYFKTITVHFFQRAIDVALFFMRMNTNKKVYVAKYKTPLAAFRKVLFDAVVQWTDGQIAKFYQSIPSFRNSDVERIEEKYREFAKVTSEIKLDNNSKLPDDLGSTLRDNLMQIFSKEMLKQEPPIISYEVKDFKESKAAVQEVAIKTFALHSATMIQKFREEFRFKLIHKIFGENHNTQTTDHLKSTLEGFCKYSIVQLPYMSLRHPPSNRLVSEDSLVFVQPLNKKKLEEYLGNLYGITDDTARGTQRQLGILEKLLETFM